MFGTWLERPLIMAALVRSVEMVGRALAAGADEVVIFWPVFRDMLMHEYTDQWNSTFAAEWKAIYDAGLMNGVPVQL